MAKIHEKFITKKHRVEMTPEHIAAELEKRHQQYLADNKPRRAYRTFCRRVGIYPVPAWAQEAGRRYKKEVDVTKDGTPKKDVRSETRRLLKKFKVNKLKGYVVHHCCGYDNEDKFVYIPVKLHNEIHKRLKSLKIEADSNHWNYIVDLINNCDKYTYTHI